MRPIQYAADQGFRDYMTTNCARCPLKALPIFTKMTAEQIAFMEKFKSGELHVDPGTPILIQGSRSPQLFTVLRGLGLRYKTLENGRRQIINFVMPGDFLGLQGAITQEMGHSVEATTEMTLCVFRRSDLWSLFRSFPSRAYDLTWLVSTEEHFLGEALASVGQRSARARVAWAMVQIHDRAEALGLIENGVMDFPFRQQDLADALGLSLVHTNKTLARLRAEGSLHWSDGRLSVRKPDILAAIAEMERSAPQTRPLM